MHNDPTGRALRLLSLLQSLRFWRASELAARLEVTERTVRRDVERLRDLGYVVDATPGKYGGYRLATGAHLPPLILDDDEAVSVAIGLGYAAGAAIEGVEETSLRALTKVEALLPHRLRRRVAALRSAVTTLRPANGDDAVDPQALSVLAAACRDHEFTRFDYRGGDGSQSSRMVEPHRLVTVGRRWYLVAWDRDRDDWRTFRVDRLESPRPVASHFEPRDIPGGDAAAHVARSLGLTDRTHRAEVAIDASYADLERVLRFIDHAPVATDAERCVVELRGEDLGRLAMAVARIALEAPVRIIHPPELAAIVGQLSHHLAVKEN